MIRTHGPGLAAACTLASFAAVATAGERQWPDLVEALPDQHGGDQRSAAAAVEPEPEPEAEPDDLSFDAGPFRLAPRAQYRLRYRHHEGHDFTEGGVSDTLRHRARLGLGVSWPKWSERLGVLIELQDVRTFGEETHTVRDTSADGFDLHQAYGSVRLLRSFEMRLGRQEIAYENERLIGAANWSEPGRSLDAVRFSYGDPLLDLDSFYAKIRESNVGLGFEGEPSGGRHLLGGNMHFDAMKELSIGVVATADLTELQGKKQATVGGIARGEIGDATHLGYAAEGYYQFGAAYGDTSYSSFLAAAQARLTLGVTARPYLEGFATLLSGDDEPEDLTERTFEVPFATNHGFYGEMDLFLDMPLDTDERGLGDFGGALGVQPSERVHLRAAYHLFRAMADRPDGLRTFGHEVDVKGEYRFWTYARLAALYGIFVPQGLKKLGVAGPQAEHFAYVTMDVTFR